LEIYQSDEETDESFNFRIESKAKELRDHEIDKLHDSYEKKFKRLDDKIRDEERDLEDAEAEKRSRRNDELFNVVETVFGGVFGKRRRRSYGSVSTKRRMARKASEKVEKAKDEIRDLEHAAKELEFELKQKVDLITQKWSQVKLETTKKEIKPRRSDVLIDSVCIAWYPYWINDNGISMSAVVD